MNLPVPQIRGPLTARLRQQQENARQARIVKTVGTLTRITTDGTSVRALVTRQASDDTTQDLTPRWG